MADSLEAVASEEVAAVAVVSSSLDKAKIFDKEINYVKSEKYREYLKNIIPLIPDYFFHVGASSTGKYHPKFSNGEGGLLRHTKAAVRIAYEILNNYALNKFTEEEKDAILVALLLHDSLKHGYIDNGYTRFEHPNIASEFILKNKFNLEDKELNLISELIKTRIEPLANFNISVITQNNKNVIRLEIIQGTKTPYYYVADGNKIVFVRIGNESVNAPTYIINELIAKGEKLTFDAMPSKYNFDDLSFTLFKATYLQKTGKKCTS